MSAGQSEHCLGGFAATLGVLLALLSCSCARVTPDRAPEPSRQEIAVAPTNALGANAASAGRKAPTVATPGLPQEQEDAEPGELTPPVAEPAEGAPDVPPEPTPAQRRGVAL